MLLIIMYLGTRYDICECNSLLRDMTISSFFLIFDLRLWPSSSVKVTFIFIIKLMLDCCVLVPSMKFVGSIEFEIWTIVWRKLKWRHYDVITFSIFMKFKHESIKGISKRHTKFHYDRTEESWDTMYEVNKELWRKNGYYVTVTLTFVPRSPISIGFEAVR